MRFALTAVLWLVTTVALAVALPAVWLQVNVIGEGGYAALAERSASDPVLQSAVAAQLTTRAMALIEEHAGRDSSLDSSEVHAAASAFTEGPAFPPLFAQVNRVAHRWLFDPSAAASGRDGSQWVVDLAPMLNDSSMRRMLSRHNVQAPADLTIPLTVTVPQPVRPGQLKPLATWGPWVAVGATALAGVCGLLTVAAARRRGKAVSTLGVSALLVGAAGWAGIEVANRYAADALNRATGDLRQIGEVMVGHAEASLHFWLNLTLVAGVALIVLGVLGAVLGSLRKS